MDFKDVFQMAVNAKYEAVKNGEAEVVSCYTTDAGVARLGLRLLHDDKHAMPPPAACRPVSVPAI